MNNQNFKIEKTLLYIGKEGAVSIEVIIGDETIWANLNQLSSLFGRDKSVISRHIKNIFEEEELNKSLTVAKIATVQNEGERKVERNVVFYNLDMIISVGYRVNSKQATEFRIWATNILKEYIVKGYVLDIKLLKNGTRFGKDYFDKLIEEIKEIRTSERRLYQKVTDIYATSYDYNSKAETTKEFFANVQNKLHYAITKHTAPELLINRINIDKPNIGLQTWENAPEGKILKKDVMIAKNVLSKKEITELNNIINMLLDYAENQAIRHNPMSMLDWINKVDSFLSFNEYPILRNKGKVKKETANRKALEIYDEYRPIQDNLYESDYDKFVKESKKIECNK